MTIQTKIHSAESGHWYRQDGTPAYTVTGKNGKVRQTTLRDARELNLVPSVTTIINVAARPQLEAWKLTQLLKAQVNNPRSDEEPQEDYAKRLIQLSQQETKDAADTGTAIHAAIERLFLGQDPGEHHDSAYAVRGLLKRITGEESPWIAEASFAHSAGFGGRVDLYLPKSTAPGYADGIVVDIKTKDFTDPTQVSVYDEQAMQLAAYREGLELPFAACINVFVSRAVPGLLTHYEWQASELSRGSMMFRSLLDYWQLSKSYIPLPGGAA